MTHYVTSVNLMMFDSEESVAHLLRFPPPELLPTKYRAEASFTLGPSNDSLKTTDQNVLIQRARQPQNELWLDYESKISKSVAENQELYILHVRQILETSPLSRYWIPTSNWTEEQISKRHARHFNIESREVVIQQEAITRYPTDLITHDTIESGYSEAEIVPWFTKALRQSFPQELRHLDIVGSGDYEMTTADATRINNHANIGWNLRSWPNAVPLLGKFFDQLHPWMIGPLPLCEILATALATFEAELYPLPEASRGGVASLGLLSIPKSAVDNAEAQRLAAPFLVPRNASTERQYWGKHPNDEIQLGKNAITFLTRRRHDVLLAEGRLDPAKSDWRPLIADKYAEMLGIERSEMLLVNIPAFYWDRNQSEIAQRYAELPEYLSPSERIWQAHYRFWSRDLRSWTVETLDFVYDRFFRTD